MLCGGGGRVEKVFSQSGRAAKVALRREVRGSFRSALASPTVDGHGLLVTPDTDSLSRGCRNPQGMARGTPKPCGGRRDGKGGCVLTS